MTKAIYALTGLMVLAAGPVMADEERGFYAGGGVGQFNVEIDNFNDIDDTFDAYDSDDTAYRAFAGWRLNRFVALEAAYVNLGNPRDTVAPATSVEYETDGFAPYVVGTLPLGPIELYARAGYYFYDAKVNVRSPLGNFSTKDSNEEFVYGGGAGLTFAKRLNVRLEYEVLDLEDTDADSLWLTAAWRF